MPANPKGSRAFSFLGKIIMGLADTIAADQQAVADAQAALDAANAKLASDRAQLDAVAPHLALWEEVETYAASLGADVEATFKSFSDRAKSLLGV